MTQTLSSPRAFLALDGLRGVAALAVAIRHAPYLWPAGHPTGFLRESHLAVDFFFLLSGFVLSHAYGARLRAGMPTSTFMGRRLIRMYPLYFIAFVLAIPVAIIRLIRARVTEAEFASNLLSGLVFLPSPLSATDLFPMNLPAWSAFLEVLANLALVLIGYRLSTRLATCIAGCAAAVLLVAVPMGWLGFQADGGALDAGPTWQSLGGGMARITFSFFAGVLVHRLYTVWRPSVRVPAWLLLIVFCVVICFSTAPDYEVIYDLIAALVVFPILLFFGAKATLPPFAARVATVIGEASYGIYVLHFPLFGLLPPAFAVLLGYKPPELSLGFGLACVVFVAITAWVVDRFIDQPLRRRLNAMLGAGRRREGAVPKFPAMTAPPA